MGTIASAPAIPFFKNAIELDPNFASAYTFLATAYGNLGETDLATENAQKAYDLRGRVSEQEKFAISSRYYWTVLGDLEQELHVYQVWEQTYPRNADPHNDSGASLLTFGEYDRAVAELQEAVRLNPDFGLAYANLAKNFLYLNRLDEAKQVAQRALVRWPDNPELHKVLYLVAFLENDTKGMEAQLFAFSGKPGEEILLSSDSYSKAYSGRLKESHDFSRRAVEAEKSANLKEGVAVEQALNALREAEFGNLEMAKQAASAALAFSSGKNAKMLVSLALARSGDSARAQSLSDELNKRFPSDTLLQRYWLPTIRGSIELTRKNPAGALQTLQAVSYELGDSGGNMYSVYVRGQAYLMARQGKEAAAEFQKILDHPTIVLNSPLRALAHIGLARAYILSGDTEKARAGYQDFLALWKDADPDIPVLKEAKAEYAKLK